MLAFDDDLTFNDYNNDYNEDDNDDEYQNDLTKLEDFSFLEESEIIKEREKLIAEAKEKFFLERDDAILVMIYYQWDIDKSDNWYENVEQNRINVGIELSKEMKEKFNKQNIKSNGDTCLICNKSKNQNNEFYSLNCGHQFCRECWTKYLKKKIKYPLNALQVKCPQKDCTCIVYEKLYFKFFNDKNIQEKINKAIYKTFIIRNPDIKQCPNEYCHLYIKSKLHYAREINCLCGTSYCFKCSTESHSPCPCEMNQKWIELKKDFYFISSNDEEKSNKLMEANTKECLNCHQKIEENEGCNYMLCDKKVGGCGYAFCYECETELSEDFNNHFFYNKYNSKQVKMKEINVEKLKEDLKIQLIEEEFLKNDINEVMNERLNFYYSRYKNLQSSIEICNNTLKNNLVKKISLMITINNLNNSDVKFINDALECVINSKRNLKNSYMFGYYLKDTQRKKLFENSQELLEYNTENLYNLLISDRLNTFIKSNSHELFEEYKSSVQNLTDIINKFRKSFLEDMENKFILDIDEGLIDY